VSNKAASNLEQKAKTLRIQKDAYELAYRELLSGVGNFAKDNPCLDLTALGQLSTDIAARLMYQLSKVEDRRKT
jgi:hypothetical protein